MLRTSRHLRSITTTATRQSQTRPRNRVAIVTGAARGIGRAIALRLARDGYSVSVSDLAPLIPQLDSLASEIASISSSLPSSSGGARAHVQAADVTSPYEVDALVRDTVRVLGPLDTMVANAGIAQVKPLLELTPEDLLSMFQVNVAGVHYCFQAAAKQMIAQSSHGSGEGHHQAQRREEEEEQEKNEKEEWDVKGKLIAAASIVAFKPFALMGHYSASKWAVRGLSQVYAMELAKHRITVNTYAPGIVDTNMWSLIDAGLGEREGKQMGEMLKKYSEDLIALGRTSVPEDVAKLVSFLASKDSDYITGQTYIVDGGIIFT